MSDEERLKGLVDNLRNLGVRVRVRRRKLASGPRVYLTINGDFAPFYFIHTLMQHQVLKFFSQSKVTSGCYREGYADITIALIGGPKG